VVGGFHTEASGVARIVADLANAMACQRHPVTVFTAVCGAQRLAADLLRPPNRLIAERGLDFGRLAWSPRLRHRIARELPGFDLVHQHNLWMLPNHYGSEAAHRLGIPVVITANGFLEPWALDHSRLKKRVAGALFQWRDLRRAACIHVNTRSEADHVRSLGLVNPLAVIPNGVDVGPFDASASSERAFDRFPRLRGRRIALFLSRLHRKKGILELIEAWGALGPEHPDWHLVVAGPDDGVGPIVRRRIESGGLDTAVTLTGPVMGADKLNLLAAAELFLLPSHSEGLSMALLEAMAARLPVVFTPGCNFPEIAAANAGIETAPRVEALTSTLRLVLSTPRERLADMGSRGRRLVEQGYTWTHCASELLAVYEWLTGRAEPPKSLLAA